MDSDNGKRQGISNGTIPCKTKEKRTLFFHTNNKKFFNLEYQSIDKYINANNLDVNNLSLKEISNIICDIRNLVLPDPKKVPNVGSFFKNSIVKKDERNGRSAQRTG